MFAISWGELSIESKRLLNPKGMILRSSDTERVTKLEPQRHNILCAIRVAQRERSFILVIRSIDSFTWFSDSSKIEGITRSINSSKFSPS